MTVTFNSPKRKSQRADVFRCECFSSVLSPEHIPVDFSLQAEQRLAREEISGRYNLAKHFKWQRRMFQRGRN